MTEGYVLRYTLHSLGSKKEGAHTGQVVDMESGNT